MIRKKHLVEYDNFIGKTNVQRGGDLSDFLNIDIVDNSPENHWKEMPEFIQEDIKPFKTVFVHFRNEEDFLEFQKLVDQSMTMKTKSVWHPALERNQISILRWIEEDSDKS